MNGLSKIIMSPIGKLYISSDYEGLTSLRPACDKDTETGGDCKYISMTEHWLDVYFSGEKNMLPLPRLKFSGTDFQISVWKRLLEIPYGETVSYMDIASDFNGGAMLCRAVGQAVKRNKFMILVPCHRVVGSNGNLVGYAYGLSLKKWLLDFEITAR